MALRFSTVILARLAYSDLNSEQAAVAVRGESLD